MKLTDEQAQEILDKYSQGIPVQIISENMGVGYYAVYRVVTGKTFQHLHGDRGTIRNIDYDEVVDLVEAGYSSTAVADKLGISATAVGKIFRKMTGRSISDFRKRKSVKYGSDAK